MVSEVPANLHARRPALSRAQRRFSLQVIGGSLLMAVAAHVAVPFWPVPLTLQTLAMFGLGAAFGPAVAAAAILAWILEGVAGLPVFAGGVGPAVLLGPTGGYIIGFGPAALIAGLAIRRDPRGAFFKTAAAFAAADAIVFLFGVAWLAVLIGWEGAVTGGLLPFILGEAIKIALAAFGTTLLPLAAQPAPDR